MNHKRKIILYILTPILLFAALFYFCNRYALFGYRGIYVLSSSMNPTIKKGQIVLGKIKHDEAEVGDIIAYEVEENGKSKLIVHRVIEKYNEGNRIRYNFKGDNNVRVDRLPVYEEQFRYIVILY